MALRTIRLEGDPILRKKSRDVKEVNDRLKILLNDMVETMKDADGVGLAAPQVGVLRRVIVLDIGEGIVKMINPQLVKKAGAEIDVEGCLSVPGLSGTVERPEYVEVKYINEEGKEMTMEGTGLLARAICHEIDHLNGILYIDKVIEYTDNVVEE